MSVYKSFLIPCLWFFLLPAAAQTELIDSLARELKSEQTDTGRVMLYNRLAREMANSTLQTVYSERAESFGKAVQYADSGLTLAQNIFFKKGEAELFRTYGAISYMKNDYEEAIFYYEKALALSSELNDDYAKAALLYNFGLIYNGQNKSIQALKYFLLSASIWDKLGREELLLATNTHITSLYSGLKEHKLSIEYANKSVPQAFELKDTLRAASLYDILAGSYLADGDTALSIEAYEQSIELYRRKENFRGEARVLHNYVARITGLPLEKRKELLARSRDLYEKADPQHHILSYIYYQLGNLFQQSGKPDSANYYHDKALEQAISSKDTPTTSSIYSSLGSVALENKEYEKAERYFRMAQQMNRQVGSTTIERTVYDGLIKIYQQKGDSKRVFDILQQAVRMEDSIMALDSKSHLDILQMQNELKELQEQQEKIWQEQAERQETTYKFRRLIIGVILTVMFFVLLLLGKVFRNYRRNKRNNMLLHERHEEILQIQEELRQSNDELNMYKAHLENMVRLQSTEQAEKDLQLRVLSDNLPGGFIYRKTVYSDGREELSYISSNVENVVGVPATELTKHNASFFPLMGDDEKIREIARKEKDCITKMEAFFFEFEFVKDGKTVWVSNHALPQPGPDNSVIWDGFVIDVTKQKEEEQSLKQAKEKAEKADRLKSVFLSNISHEIRTPMNAILGFIGFIENENLPAGKRTEYIRIIHNSVNQLMLLIENIIDISKLEVRQIIIHPVKFSLNTFLNDIKDEWVETINNRPLNIILDDSRFLDADIIENDPKRLKQVLANLLDNAVKYTDKGYIRFGYEPADDKSELLFFVEDTGIGIPRNQYEIIFEYFRQGENAELKPQYGGIGLGLSISQGLVTRMGGKIWVESTENMGSTFYFTIKRERQTLGQATPLG